MVVRVLEDVAVVVRHHGNRLGDVDGRAAAEAHDGVGAVGAVCGHAVIDLLSHRVAGYARVHLHLEAFELRGEIVQDGKDGEALVGDDQRPLHALLPQVLGDELAGAGAEMNGRGEGEAFDGHCARQCGG